MEQLQAHKGRKQGGGAQADVRVPVGVGIGPPPPLQLALDRAQAAELVVRISKHLRRHHRANTRQLTRLAEAGTHVHCASPQQWHGSCGYDAGVWSRHWPLQRSAVPQLHITCTWTQQFLKQDEQCAVQGVDGPVHSFAIVMKTHCGPPAPTPAGLRALYHLHTVPPYLANVKPAAPPMHWTKQLLQLI